MNIQPILCIRTHQNKVAPEEFWKKLGLRLVSEYNPLTLVFLAFGID
jgi:hypothetical protein